MSRNNCYRGPAAYDLEALTEAREGRGGCWSYQNFMGHLQYQFCVAFGQKRRILVVVGVT